MLSTHEDLNVVHLAPYPHQLKMFLIFKKFLALFCISPETKVLLFSYKVGTDLDYGRPGESHSPKNFPRMYWSQASKMNLEWLREIRQTRVFHLSEVSQFRTPLEYCLSEISEKAPDLCQVVLTISNCIWQLLAMRSPDALSTWSHLFLPVMTFFISILKMSN